MTVRVLRALFTKARSSHMASTETAADARKTQRRMLLGTSSAAKNSTGSTMDSTTDRAPYRFFTMGAPPWAVCFFSSARRLFFRSYSGVELY